ncbi:hypothetical protein H0A36_23270 [Endozoicomonas sp. SM1973]|uniref:Uncharacterized protein n=1 Tax=Spartinivicinus marinus TaxID=2994442 RepID=A0A853IIM1_9GAMM|nr:type III secretion system chaperone [Spartinivicinus marinus]MCX4027762.1 type III secretion system chaperone [Spartinivicinus marinus]NYZ68945.1 hypothetical protein [Spartinivicinus marinus]
MNKEEIINVWLAEISGGQWQLLNNECNLNSEDGQHYATIIHYPNRLAILFPLPPADQPDNKQQLHNKLLMLNNHPDAIGIASFSLAADNATIVLSTSLPDSSVLSENLEEFWKHSISLRNALFEAVINN